MIPHMNYQQYRTARRLVHSCCNYEGGNCLLLDNGEECVCVQSITYSLICKWFRAAVQQQAVSTLIIAAVMYQPAGSAVLLVVHVWDHGSSSMMGSLM